MRIAVIDLGTNTSNLLVAEVNAPCFTILHQSKELVKLGDGKIRENEISSEATTRAIQSLIKHKAIIENFHVDKIRVLATSAVRTAENKVAFLDALGRDSGWVVKVISGEKEAELIFNGVLLAFEEFCEPCAILDIGGGSNEIIVAHGKEILWKESQPAGMARVISKFKISDPLTNDEAADLSNYFEKIHHDAFEQCKKQGVKTLVGCSGAFDTIADIIDRVNPGEKIRTKQKVTLTEFYGVYQTLLDSTRDQRLSMKGMDHVRVDLIVPAMILIERLISTTGIGKIIQTDFALREGVLFEMMNQNHTV